MTIESEPATKKSKRAAKNKSQRTANRIFTNGLNGAGIGLVFGCLSFAYVGIVRIVMPEAQGELRNMSMVAVGFLYLIVAPAIGFLGGVGRTWLRGRLGSTILFGLIGAAVTAIVLPFLPNVKGPWGGLHYSVIALMAVLSALMFGMRSD